MIVRQPPRIVAVGAGYAGLSTALRLARQAAGRARVELLDGRAEHQLITRLHEVATGRLAPAAAAVPLGVLLAGTGIRLQRAWVEGIDLEHGRVTTSAGALQYDALVLAPGSRTDYRGVPGAAELALPLRTLGDALRLREKVGTHLRQAARSGDAERDSAFTYLVVGGGYTGIELAPELAYWRSRRADGTRIGLLEAGPRLLPGGDGWLAREAAAGLERLGVQLFLGTPALSVDASGVQIQSGQIRAQQVVWATGVRAPRLLAESGLQLHRDGRVLVDRRLAAIGHAEVLVLGDAAAGLDSAGLPLPSSAQLAVQQAKWAADTLAAALRGRSAAPFVARLEGEALSLGPDDGLARVGSLALAEAPAVLVMSSAWPAQATSASSAGRLCQCSSAPASTCGSGGPSYPPDTRAPPNAPGVTSSPSELIAPTEQPGATALTGAARIPGPIVLFGSGEPSPMARRVHGAALAGLNAPIRECVLETPAGFEPNSARVAGYLADFLRQRLAPFQPEVVVVPARRRGTPFSPDDPDVVTPLLRSNYVVLGPGSPTYAATQLAGSLAWQMILARPRLGAPLVLASAAAIAASAHALPVYEIYKVGEDLSWKPGLDLRGPYGRSVAIIPHWNNRDGGEELDTSRGFMGQARFERLLRLLPPDVDVVGIDEHTALMLDFVAGTAVAFGRGGVSWLHAETVTRLDSGASVPLASVGLTRLPEPTDGLPDDVWHAARTADSGAEPEPEPPPAALAELFSAREAARNQGDWALADKLRADIVGAGWQVHDTHAGPLLVPA